MLQGHVTGTYCRDMLQGHVIGICYRDILREALFAGIC